MCGIPAEGDNSLIPLYSVFLGLAGVAMILRIVARVLTHAYFWWDDFANLFGFVCHPTPDPCPPLTQIQIGSATFTALNIKCASPRHPAPSNIQL
jgi:hypothetical protein